jgi:hypothetical protein
VFKVTGTGEEIREIKSWQMVIIPYATGASLSLPEKRTPGFPWVMNSGSPMAHIMVEH